MKTEFICSLILIITSTVGETLASSETNSLGQSAPPISSEALQLTPELLTQFADEMAASHPALLAARARTNAAEANVRSIRTWDDPMIRVGGMAADRMMRMDDGDLFYGIEQKLPLFGKPAAMRRMAGAELAVEVAREEARFQLLRRDLSKALVRAAGADEALAIAREDLEWLNLTATAVEESYRAGNARLMDLLTIQNERSKRIEQLVTDQENRNQAVLVVNRFLNRPLTNAWPPLRLPPVAEEIAFHPRLVSFALAQAPELKIMREELQMAAAAVTVARKERWPEVSIGFENRTYTRDHDLRSTEVMLGFSIPLGNHSKYRAAIQRETAKQRAVEWETRHAEQAVREEVHGLIVKIAAARREALLYRDQIIPRNEQALASARAMFESGGPLRDVLEARRMWFEGKLMYVRAVTEQYDMLTELILCCGLGDLESLQMISSLSQPENP